MLPKKGEIELPKWFVMEKYEGTKDLDPLGWYVQIRRRLRFNLFPMDPGWPLEFELEDIRENPLGPDKFDTRLPSEFSSSSEGVRLATYGDIKTLWSSFHHKSKPMPEESKKSFWRKTSEVLELLKTPAHLLSDLPSFSQGKRALLIVNLEIPKKLLQQRFKFLLESIPDRKVGVKKKPRSIDNELGILSDFAVLPYWDISFWANELQKKITDEEMCDILFPGLKAGAETVRKTTKKYAKRVFSIPYLDILGAVIGK
ncbi:MAG: DUF6387 family protein [Candidatus Ozemobacteraceae bacterium]